MEQQPEKNHDFPKYNKYPHDITNYSRGCRCKVCYQARADYNLQYRVAAKGKRFERNVQNIQRLYDTRIKISDCNWAMNLIFRSEAFELVITYRNAGDLHVIKPVFEYRYNLKITERTNYAKFLNFIEKSWKDAWLQQSKTALSVDWSKL